MLSQTESRASVTEALQNRANRREHAAAALRVILPTLWLGMVIAISFIEAPLKFQAPGITIPLGLGIGRLVFTALNIAEISLLIGTTLVMLWPRASRSLQVVTGLLWVTTLVKVFIVRPPLNARSDVIVAGGNPGESLLHYVYIGMDVVGLALLVVLITLAARRMVPLPNLESTQPAKRKSSVEV